MQRTVRPLRYDRFSNSLLEQEKSMKKLLCILLVLMLILTGCSGKEADKDVENKLKSALETSADSAPAKPEVKGTLLETKLWKLTYPDDWSCEEDALHDEEERCDVELIISYFYILVLIPIFAAKNDPFARYHANQGLILFILQFILNVISNVAVRLLVGVSATLVWGLTFGINILMFVILIFNIIGIINAAKGRMKPLPIFGGIKILK